MTRRKPYLHTIVLSLALGLLIGPAPAAEKKGMRRPAILKVYPNPASHGETIYLEGKNFRASGRTLTMSSAAEDNGPQEGTYVEFTTKYGTKRVPARLMENPPIQDAQVCAVTVPKTAVSGGVKIITIKKEDVQPVGSMSATVDLCILNESSPKAPAGWSHGAVSLIKAAPKKLLRDAFYYQTERTAREAKNAFVRQETWRMADAPYDINRSSYFNAPSQISYGRPTGGTPGEEEWIRPAGQPSFAARFFAKPKSRDQRSFYSLNNAETMQKDIQEDIYNYTKPLFERLFHMKAEPEARPEKTGFTRPQVRLAYSIGLAHHDASASYGGLTRNVGVRIDFDYVRINPLSEQMRRVMSFSVGADSRRTDLESGREQRFLLLLRFR